MLITLAVSHLGLQVFDQAAVQAAIDKVMAETYVLQDKEEKFGRL